jgi:sulfoxide reductase heme-binding subunit YedZ
MVLLERLQRNWLRLLVHIGALLPLAWTIWQYSQGMFLVDPVREITTRTGKTALILLVSSLACTPLSMAFGFKQALQVRRALGLYAFFYASLHFATFVGLDYGFDLGLLPQAILDQRYVVVGFAAGLMLLVLALTSTRNWQKRLGKNWRRLHRMVYVAAFLVIVHFLWLSKDILEPLRYAALVALLLVLRLPFVRRSVSRIRQRLKNRLSPASHVTS